MKLHSIRMILSVPSIICMTIIQLSTVFSQQPWLSLVNQLCLGIEQGKSQETKEKELYCVKVTHFHHPSHPLHNNSHMSLHFDKQPFLPFC